MEWLTSERVVDSHLSFSLLSSKIGEISQPSLECAHCERMMPVIEIM